MRNAVFRQIADGGVWLSRQEASLLDVFASRPNRVLSKELLATMLSSQEVRVKPRSIEVSVHRLRRKAGHLDFRIETVREIGYVMKITGRNKRLEASVVPVNR
ncbi:winged helix-turn-helix domain-containing protein [Achromobacter kerstersii]|jgi:two-component system response regulator TctD